MAVNKSKAKGSRAELALCKYLTPITGWNWERIPLSGSLDAKHGLKGDVYIPKQLNKYCVEVKHYKDDHLTSKMLSSKSPQVLDWWEQTIRETEENEAEEESCDTDGNNDSLVNISFSTSPYNQTVNASI